MPHLSSGAYSLFVLLNGAMTPGAFVAASLQVGDNGTIAEAQSSPEYSICGLREAAHGRLVWDPDHRGGGAASPFFGVAPVRFQLTPGECRLSVGTGDYLRTSTAPYRWINRIQIGAITGAEAPGRSITWDFIEIDFTYAGGRTETHRSTCLPRVASRAALRQSSGAGGSRQPRPQQFTEIATHCREVVEIKIRGQVTLRANEHSAEGSHPLLAEDIQGRIQVFTDAA